MLKIYMDRLQNKCFLEFYNTHIKYELTDITIRYIKKRKYIFLSIKKIIN